MWQKIYDKTVSKLACIVGKIPSKRGFLDKSQYDTDKRNMYFSGNNGCQDYLLFPPIFHSLPNSVNTNRRPSKPIFFPAGSHCFVSVFYY